jgi:phage terminase large subunit GpA-like protein
MEAADAQLTQIWREAWRPPDRQPAWQWAEAHIRSIPYSPMPGRFRVENSPQIREVLDAVVDPKVRLVSILAAVQSSKTTAPEISLCYIIANLPGPTLWLDQTDEDAKDQSESRLQKLFDECEPVKALFPADRHKKRNHTIHFANGMTLWIVGAHNKTNLQRRSIRWLIGDETWRWPPGHMAEAEARVTAFGWLGKCVFMSQGGEEDDDTHRKFETTDMREWTFECPHCGHRQPFLWENVEWSKDCKDENEQYDFSKVHATTVLRCASCNFYFDDADETRRRLNASGRFVPQNPRASRENVGFHWNALATMSWGRLAELYLRAKQAARKGDTSLLQQFYQKRLALPWREYLEDFKLEITTSGYRLGDLWCDEGGIDRFGKVVPPPFAEGGRMVPLRVVTVDCQIDHLFVVVRSWSAEGSSRLLWCERVLTFEDIDALQKRFAVHSNLVFVDAGNATYEVYKQCSERGWIALMGDRRATFVHKGKARASVQRFYSPRRKVVLGHNRWCHVHYWSNLNIKDSLARLRRNQDPANGVTWEVPDDVPEDYLKQMESEHRVKDKGKWVWKQIGSRPNHYFDCEAMQTAAATMLKLIGREAAAASEPEESTEPEQP